MSNTETGTHRLIQWGTETLPGIASMWLVTLAIGAYTVTHAGDMGIVNWLSLAGMVVCVGSITAIWWWDDE